MNRRFFSSKKSRKLLDTLRVDTSTVMINPYVDATSMDIFIDGGGGVEEAHGKHGLTLAVCLVQEANVFAIKI